LEDFMLQKDVKLNCILLQEAIGFLSDAEALNKRSARLKEEFDRMAAGASSSPLPSLLSLASHFADVRG
jgi:hypothetical protein